MLRLESVWRRCGTDECHYPALTMAVPHPSLLHLVREGVFPDGVRVAMPIVDSAAEHGVAPLLDEAVRREGRDGDHEALVALAMRSLETEAATQATGDALLQLAGVAASLSIDVAVFKGLAIGSRWYPRPELRPAADVDVFVNPAQSGRLGELLDALAPDSAPRDAVEAMLTEGRVFEHPVNFAGVAVDVHVDPMNLVVATRQKRLVWQRTVPLDLGQGLTVRTLDLEISIIQALLHLARDDFADLLHICDISRMLEAGPDWTFVESFAATEGWRDLVRFSLGAVCDILGRPSPLPTTLEPANSAFARLFWPERIRLRGADRVFQGAQRQSVASLLITGRRLEVAGALIRRMLPPRSVIDDRHAGASGPYPVALLHWRLAQRAEIKHRRTAAREAVQHATR